MITQNYFPGVKAFVDELMGMDTHASSKKSIA
jgi:hypothetical protein